MYQVCYEISKNPVPIHTIILTLFVLADIGSLESGYRIADESVEIINDEKLRICYIEDEDAGSNIIAKIEKWKE